MDKGELNKELSRLKGLLGNRGKTVEELEKQAGLNLHTRSFKKNPLFTDPDEIKISDERFRNYLKNNELDSLGEIDTLRSLIYVEIFEIRLQKELNKIHADAKVPFEKLTKQLTDIQNQKMILKVKLGIDRDAKEDNDLTKLQMLEKRFNRYILEHRAEFTLAYSYKCSKCKHQDVELVLVRKRIKDFTALRHPWFAGRYLFNYEILKDVKNKVITKKQAWKYLCCASSGGNYEGSFSEEYTTDYIQYCLDNWVKIISHFEK